MSQGDKFRADIVGSMLRPDYLHRAREEHGAGRLSDHDFKQVEDRAVDDCIDIQERSGVDILSDGEMRRNVFASQLAEASEGFASITGNEVEWFTLDGERDTSPVTVGLVSKIKRKRHLSAEEYVYLRAKTELPIKMTLPSPTMYAYYWVPGVSDAAYPSTEAYMADVTDILRDEVAELVRLGADYVQIDAPELGMIVDPVQQEWFRGKGFTPEYMLDQGVDMINAVVEGHPGITFALHICRGNDASRYMAKGGYADLARSIFTRAKVERLLLEYDDERSGDFAPLSDVPDGVMVVLGLITTKWPRKETPEELKSRVEDASRYIDLDRLALSTQCGFASVAKGNALGFEHQEAKLRMVADVAREIWED